ncbi:unnamed protein product [Larinioides sclopetarius]|uniref:Sushi domain-containing protein n=1 Tax=Larinioides sclopetarius TaxID=280406 RepID=A0AAV2BFZ2_9ARAC
MALIVTLWYALLTFLGLGIRHDSERTELTVGSCSGLHVTDGSVSCSNNGEKTVCRVECGGKYRGEFTCTEEEGWSPELPICAKPMEGDNDYEGPAPRDNGCPNDNMCAQSCRNRGYKSGKCRGNTCNCR